MELILGAVEDICRTKKVRQEENDESIKTAKYTSKGKSKLFCVVLKGHTGSVHSCQFFDADKYILSSSEDSTVKLWNSKTLECVHTFCDNQCLAILKAHVAPDNKSFVTAGVDKRLLHWNLETNQIMWESVHKGIVLCCHISKNGRLLASGTDNDHEIKIWDLRMRKPVHRLPDLHSQAITSIKFTDEDERIVSTSMDYSVKVYDLKVSKNTLRLSGHQNIVSNCAFDATGRNLATTGWDKKVLIWDVKTGKYRQEGPLQISGHDGSVSCCVFSQNGQFLISGSYDESIIIWDLNDVTEKLKLNGHMDWVEDVDISQKQDWLVSCSKDRTIRMWDIQNIHKIQVTNPRVKQAPRVMQCEKCLKPFIPASDLRGYNLLMCLYCKLDLFTESETESKPETDSI